MVNNYSNIRFDSTSPRRPRVTRLTANGVTVLYRVFNIYRAAIRGLSYFQSVVQRCYKINIEYIP